MLAVSETVVLDSFTISSTFSFVTSIFSFVLPVTFAKASPALSEYSLTTSFTLSVYVSAFSIIGATVSFTFPIVSLAKDSAFSR